MYGDRIHSWINSFMVIMYVCVPAFIHTFIQVVSDCIIDRQLHILTHARVYTWMDVGVYMDGEDLDTSALEVNTDTCLCYPLLLSNMHTHIHTYLLIYITDSAIHTIIPAQMKSRSKPSGCV